MPPPEPSPLDVVKDYLRVLDNVENDKIEAMVPRARLWVEEYTGIALMQREFIELRRPRAGRIRLTRGPLVSVDAVNYVDGAGDAQIYVPHYQVPETVLSASMEAPWPYLSGDQQFEIVYTAGLALDDTPTELEKIDSRLIGALLALVEGEYSEGYAYPDRAVESAKNCLTYLRIVA